MGGLRTDREGSKKDQEERKQWTERVWGKRDEMWIKIMTCVQLGPWPLGEAD